jgi:hypothetical protein
MDPSEETPNFNIPYFIDLSNGKEAMKEIYFVNGKGSFVSNRPTRNPLIALIILLLLAGFFYLLSLSNKINLIVLFTLTVILALWALIVFVRQMKAYLQWKNGVDAYLKELGKFEKQTLNLNQQSFELVNEKDTIIEKWAAITKASIRPTHITLYGGSQPKYMFPAKAMSASNYRILKEIVRQVMKDPTVIVEVD